MLPRGPDTLQAMSAVLSVVSLEHMWKGDSWVTSWKFTSWLIMLNFMLVQTKLTWHFCLTVPNDRIAQFTINIGKKIWKLFTAEQLYVKCKVFEVHASFYRQVSLYSFMFCFFITEMPTKIWFIPKSTTLKMCLVLSYWYTSYMF